MRLYMVSFRYHVNDGQGGFSTELLSRFVWGNDEAHARLVWQTLDTASINVPGYMKLSDPVVRPAVTLNGEYVERY